MKSENEKTESKEVAKAIQIEEQMLDFWDQNRIFQKSLEQTKDGTPYVFFDGPPFATGLPHYGHILASAIKDAIPRYWTMKGYYVRRRWGWDCHGLPIEQLVEQKLEISGKQQIEALGIDKFNAICRENVLGYVHDWAKTVRRIGRFVEFENSYKTMDSTYMESEWWALKQVWDKQLIYEGRRAMLYCPRCETPLSNFEVAMDNSYNDAVDDTVYIQAKLVAPEGATTEPVYILFWTTTPWTLPANVALAVGPDIDYVVIKPTEPEHGGRQYLVAKAQAEVLFNNPQIVADFTGSELAGLEYEPLFASAPHNKNAHKIYTADYVTTDDGTGIVHIAPVYGEEDYNFGLQYDLPIVPLLDQRGHFDEAAPEFLRGMYYRKGNDLIIERMRADGKLFKTLAHSHSVANCWRCGTRLYYNAIPSWFIAINKVKDRLRELNAKQINWYPAHLKEGRFDKGLENAPDWNISRNRYWATPLPFWKCSDKSCAKTLCIGSLQELSEKAKNYSEVYSSTDIREVDLHRPQIDKLIVECPDCGKDMRRTEEVLDCWLESACMPFAEFHAPFENEEVFKKFFPAQFVSEYISQTRAWFYVMHVISGILFDRAPFENVVATGIVQAEDGQKMSKSKQNYPDPDLVIQKSGADALRFYVLTSPVVQAENLNFSERELDEIYRKLIMTMHNVHSFYRMYRPSEANAASGAYAGGLPQAKHPMDRWILAMLHQLQIEVTARMDQYDLSRAGKPILAFVSDLSTWYVRRSRDRAKAGGPDAEMALDVMAHVMIELSKLMAPFTPMIAEYLYKDVSGEESVHLAKWNEEAAHEPMSKHEQGVIASMEGVREIVELGLALRKEANLKVRQPLAELTFMSKAEGGIADESLQQIIAEELNVKVVLGAQEAAAQAKPALKESANYAVSLDLDITPELREEGLARELERQVQELRKKSGLQVGELIDIYYNTNDASLEMAILGSFDRKKTFAMQIKKEFEVETDFEIQTEVEGSAIWLGIVKI